MLEEVTEAAKWWTQRLPASIGAVMAEKFQTQLIKLIQQKYEGHWHPKDKKLGSAFRTISYDHRIDPILLQASEAAGIKNIERLLENSRYIMFVNPGEVRVKNVSNADTFWDADVESVWRRAPSADEKNDTVTSPSASTAANGGGSPTEATTSPTLSPEPSPPGSPKHLSQPVIRNGPSRLQAGAPAFVPSPAVDKKDEGKSTPVPQASPTAASGSGNSNLPQVTILPRPAAGARGQGQNISVSLVRNN